MEDSMNLSGDMNLIKEAVARIEKSDDPERIARDLVTILGSVEGACRTIEHEAGLDTNIDLSDERVELREFSRQIDESRR